MALSKIDKTLVVVTDNSSYGARGFRSLDSLNKGTDLVQIIQNGYKLGKITESWITGYVKVQLLQEIYGEKKEDTYTELYFKSSELTYLKDYKKTVKIPTATATALQPLKDYWAILSQGSLNVREKPSTSAKSIRKLVNNQYVGKSDGVPISAGANTFYRFVNSLGAVYYVSAANVTETKPSVSKVKTTNKKDKEVTYDIQEQPDIEKNETEVKESYLDISGDTNWTPYIIAIIILLLILGYIVKRSKANKLKLINGEPNNNYPKLNA
jgi:hypothetical protein